MFWIRRLWPPWSPITPYVTSVSRSATASGPYGAAIVSTSFSPWVQNQSSSLNPIRFVPTSR